MKLHKPSRSGFVLVLIAGLFCTSAVCTLANGQNNEPQRGPMPLDPQELEAFMDGAISAAMKAHHIPGATVSVVEDGEIILARGYGYADIDNKTPAVANQTLFRVGSVSKLFVWTAVMQLVEEGKLDLDADINIYLEDFQVPANYPQPITLKNLMTHTPGFEDLASGGRLFVRNETDVIPLGDYLKDEMPARVRPPGTVTAYSNYGSALAAYIVEQASGMPFEEYVEERIFKPLKMNNSSFEQPVPPELAANLSSGYIYQNNAYIAQPFEYIQLWPAGSMSSTSEDMARFMIANLEGGRHGNSSILDEDSVRLMHSQLFTNDRKVSGWTYGFWETYLNNQRLIGHGGDTLQFHTVLDLIPEDNIGIFISFNEQNSESAVYEVLENFMNHYHPLPIPLRSGVPTVSKISNASKDLTASPTPLNSTIPPNSIGSIEGSYCPTRSSYTNFEKVGDLFTQVNVDAGPDGILRTSKILAGERRWVETEPLLFRPADGMPPSLLLENAIVFGLDTEGDVNRFFYANNPTLAYEKVAWYERANFNYLLLVASILLFLSALIWPLGRVFNRCPKQSEKTARIARWVAGVASILSLLMMIALGAIFALDFTSLIYNMPLEIIIALAIGVVVAVLALVCVILAALAWKDGYWSLAGRAHYTLVVLGLVAYVWWLNNWNLLGFRF